MPSGTTTCNGLILSRPLTPPRRRTSHTIVTGCQRSTSRTVYLCWKTQPPTFRHHCRYHFHILSAVPYVVAAHNHNAHCRLSSMITSRTYTAVVTANELATTPNIVNTNLCFVFSIVFWLDALFEIHIRISDFFFVWESFYSLNRCTCCFSFCGSVNFNNMNVYLY